MIWNYGYDQLGRLIEVKQNNVVVESYTYDADGNRLTEMNSLRYIDNKTYTYSNEDHIITAGTDTYQFDKDGFLTSKITSAGTTTFNYSSRGELLNATLPDGTAISYDYDPMGRRIAKRVNGTIVEKYLWQGLTRLLSVYDSSNNLIMRFTYADGRVPISMTKSGATYYLLYDQIGSLRAVMDVTGAVVKEVLYDSFGNIIYDSNPSFMVPFGFAGGLHDRDTGLVRFGLRDYDPTIGRWTAKDPIDFAGGDVNLFNYVLNNPVNWIDPSGLLIATVNYGNSPYSSVTMVWNSWLPSFYTSGTIGGNGVNIQSGIYSYQYGQHPMNPDPGQTPYPALNLYTLSGNRTLPATRTEDPGTTATGINFHRGNSVNNPVGSGSTGCHVIPRNNWNSFISQFGPGDSGTYIYIRLGF
jgi:RHS repeat-associated protein